MGDPAPYFNRERGKEEVMANLENHKIVPKEWVLRKELLRGKNTDHNQLSRRPNMPQHPLIKTISLRDQMGNRIIGTF